MSRSATIERAAPESEEHEYGIVEISRLGQGYLAGEVQPDEYFDAVERLAEHAVDEELADAGERRKARG